MNTGQEFMSETAAPLDPRHPVVVPLAFKEAVAAPFVRVDDGSGLNAVLQESNQAASGSVRDAPQSAAPALPPRSRRCYWWPSPGR